MGCAGVLLYPAMRRYRIGLLSLVALCGSVVAAPFSVSLPVAPKPWERTAAKELETWLVQAAKDGEVSVDGCDGVVFHVGDTELAKAKGLAGLEDERWVIRSFGRDVC